MIEYLSLYFIYFSGWAVFVLICLFLLAIIVERIYNFRYRLWIYQAYEYYFIFKPSWENRDVKSFTTSNWSKLELLYDFYSGNKYSDIYEWRTDHRNIFRHKMLRTLSKYKETETYNKFLDDLEFMDK